MGQEFLEIARKIEKLAHTIPTQVQYRKPKFGPTILCIHTSALDILTKETGLVRRDATSPKTSEWLTASDLMSRFIGDPKKNRTIILAKMNELIYQMHGKIQLKSPKTGIATLCLHTDALDEFAALAGLIIKKDFAPKTPEWLTTSELTNSYFSGKHSTIFPKISAALKELQNQIPDQIQYRKIPATGNAILCAHISALPIISKHTELIRTDNVPTKTNEWLNATELTSKYISGSASKNQQLIAEKLQELKDVMPHAIQMRRPYRYPPILCLNINALDEFVNLAQLRKKTHALPKTPEWLSPCEIMQTRYKGGQTTVLAKIAQAFNILQERMPDKIQPRKPRMSSVTTCIHISALDELDKITNLSLKQNKGTGTNTNNTSKTHKFNAASALTQTRLTVQQTTKDTNNTKTH